jgi:hypothetical protein
MTTPSELELLNPSDLRERDVDLLLREELYVSEPFQRFFFSHFGEQLRAAEFVRARHSVDRYAGESDLEVDVNCSGQSIRLLVEDKIDAEFQKGQAERYGKAGNDYVKKLECKQFCTVLVAPDSYLAGSKHGFDETIPLETILKWFEQDSSTRSRYKASLLRSIIQKTGTDRPKDPKITQFWEDYYGLADSIAKKLRMRRPGGRSGGFLFFNPDDMPRYLDLVHKLNKGYVDLQFSMLKPAFDEFSRKIRPLMTSEMLVRKTGESASVSLWVGELETNKGFSIQREDAERGIRAAERLWDWFKTNRTELESVYLSLLKKVEHPSDATSPTG